MKEKGCLSGCLIVIVVVVALAGGLLVAGYLNRGRIMTAVMDRLDLKFSTVMEHVGTKTQSGLPPEFLDEAYEIDLREQGESVKVARVDLSRDKAYARLVEHFEAEGWEVVGEAEVMEGAPEQIESLANNMEQLRVAEMEKDGQQMNIAVTGYRGETVGIVWHAPATGDVDTDPDPGNTDDGKKEVADNSPEEAAGNDPERMALRRFLWY